MPDEFTGPLDRATCDPALAPVLLELLPLVENGRRLARQLTADLAEARAAGDRLRANAIRYVLRRWPMDRLMDPPAPRPHL